MTWGADFIVSGYAEIEGDTFSQAQENMTKMSLKEIVQNASDNYPGMMSVCIAGLTEPEKITQKQIKDLTIDEIKNICSNHPSCDNCPLAEYVNGTPTLSCIGADICCNEDYFKYRDNIVVLREGDTKE